MKSIWIITLVLFLYTVTIEQVNSYGTGGNCEGLSYCTSLVTDDPTLAEFDANGTVVECKFGQTAADVESFERCEVECDFDTYDDCVCISEEDATRGKRADQAFMLFIAVGCLIAFLGVCGCQYCARIRYKQSLQAYDEAVGVKKEDVENDDETEVKEPSPPKPWIYVILYVFFSLGALFSVLSGFAIFDNGFWAGCGQKPGEEIEP